MELSLTLSSADHHHRLSNNPSPSEAHPDTMDFLSREWCNFAVQSLQPDHIIYDRSIVPVETSIAKFHGDSSPVSCAKMDKSLKMDDPDFKPSMPSWKTNDVKSWIWMQQAMHPELSYEGFFRKKLKLPWKITPSLKKWWKEIKAKRKEEVRLQKAEVHAAVSLAGLAAALAAVASENAGKEGSNNRLNTRETAVASAAAVVAAQCAQMAETMGANRDQLSTVIGSSMTGTSVSEILALTASATTSLRGAATLKARRSCNINRLNGSEPVLPIEGSSDLPPEFDKNTYLLAQGTDLFVETPDGDFKARTVSVVLNKEGKVILKMKKHNLLRTKKECIVTNVHVELYKDSESEDNNIEDTCYLIVLKTNRGAMKLDMADDYSRYKTWITTIQHMLTLSSSSFRSKYDLTFYNKN
ncbi:VAN3-binding protein isoform X1 [Raphanus sativus]|uniref:VAN3-binding protein isoform X1 n=2 Tax=Raphanus sativus TaxID=3726 RepID=A0A6J0L4R1_RAPSA|nr:VAN3-binding protein isoform X1 [Raphanus sativus]